MKIYLAGKVSKNDWRHEVVPSLHEAAHDPQSWREVQHRGLSSAIKLSSGAVHDYVGPFFIACDHGCYHTTGKHGAGSLHQPPCIAVDRITIEEVKAASLAAIRRADVVFAWFDDLTAFGTIYEIGYAHALGKKVVVGLNVEGHSMSEAWFAIEGLPLAVASSATEAFGWAMREHTDLPGATFIEAKFWEAWRELWDRSENIDLKFQHVVGRYRLDFAVPSIRLGIELDGLVGHSTPADIEKDRRRQRELEALGWTVIRFGGREVTRDASACALEVFEKVKRLSAKETP